MDKKRLILVISFIIIFMIAIILSLIYYNDKYMVSFETGCDDVILTQYVKRNDKVKQPLKPEKDGYVFIEWQLNGNSYDFDAYVKSDMILTAKWIKEEYIKVNFNTNSNYEIKSNKILKGDVISELPIPVKENYEFIGWYLNGNLYNNVPIYDDITLTAHYKNSDINTTFKKGDKVKIIGSYSSSAYSKYSYHKKAIGWEREILGIIDNSNYMYMVGNKNIVTGFFKASSIEKIN